MQKTAKLARTQVRKSDVIARWGGDEFVIMLQKCDAETAINLLNNIRKQINDKLNDDKTNFTISISAGIAEYKPGDTCDTLLARADKNLYRAKKQGRNRIVGPVTQDDRQRK